MTPESAVCPVCRSAELYDVFHWPDVPSNSALFLPTAEEARAHPRGSLRLVGCRSCGFLFNADVDEALVEYSERWTETQAWSARFQEFATALAADWVDRFALRGKTVLEIGCGRDPSFLRLICSLSDGDGIGIDPTVDPVTERGITLISDRFDERHLGLNADAVVCRHTLEHIVDVGGFLGVLRRWSELHPGAVHLFEVPDVARILEKTTFWDVFYEHPSYFSECSLRAAFSLGGFQVEEVRLAYEGQYLLLAARPASAEQRAADAADCGSRMAELAADFSGRVERATAAAHERLTALAADGPVLIWQASSKAVGFLTATGGAGLVTALVDVNPTKRGLFLVGSGLPIVGADDVPALRARHVVLMNEIYLEEVGTALAGAAVDAQLHSADDLLGGAVS